MGEVSTRGFLPRAGSVLPCEKKMPQKSATDPLSCAITVQFYRETLLNGGYLNLAIRLMSGRGLDVKRGIERRAKSTSLSVSLGPLGPSGSSSSRHRRKPEIVLWKGHAFFRITSLAQRARNLLAELVPRGLCLAQFQQLVPRGACLQPLYF